MVVLDSDILVEILRGNKGAMKFIERLEFRGEKLNTTVINAFELFKGALAMNKKIDPVETLLRSFGCYNFNGPSSWAAAKIYAELKKSGDLIDFEDIAIASIAQTNNEMLITRNVKHFSRIKDLKTEKW